MAESRYARATDFRKLTPEIGTKGTEKVKRGTAEKQNKCEHAGVGAGIVESLTSKP